MNAPAQDFWRDLRSGVIELSTPLLGMVIRLALMLGWTLYGPLWAVDLITRDSTAWRPEDVLAAFFFVWGYLLIEWMLSVLRLLTLNWLRIDRAAMGKAEVVKRAELW